MSLFDEKGIEKVSITDFSPGIHLYSRGQFSNNSNAWLGSPAVPPPGAASFAARCISEPGVGLVPFYAHTPEISLTLPGGNSPAASPWVSFIPVGVGTIKAGNNAKEASFGGNFLDLGVYPRADYLVYVYLGKDQAGNVYTTGVRRYSTDGTTPFNRVDLLWSNTPQDGNVPCTACFARSAQTTVGNAEPMAQLWLGHTAAINADGFNPSYMPAANGQPHEIMGTLHFVVYPCDVFAHSGRVNLLIEFASQTYLNVPTLLSARPTQFRFTDPPTSDTAISRSLVINFFAPEEPSGVGAWGSVSTGELFIVNESSGGYSINGDVGFPSFVNRLPGVHGTGQLKQRATSTSMGMIYVTDTDGIYAWNGGNNSRKISTQIPDNATIRFDLHPGSSAWGPGGLGAIGIRTFHDRLNQFTFFPNNWVLDSETGGWWLCEDPAVQRYGVWQASACGDRFMYAQPLGPYLPGQSVTAIETFDATTAANTWTWISAPIRGPRVGMLPNLVGVEIIASDPGTTGATAASLRITPQVLNWDTPQANPTFTATAAPALVANNPQSVQFTLPNNAQGYRASQELGFTDGMFCVRIDATGQAGLPAPVLHEIHLAVSYDRPSGV